MDNLINGVVLSSLRIIKGDKGNIMHALKADENSFNGFGEAYFSTVNEKSIKGWKCHLRMVLNIVVPVGCIRFVVYDDRVGSKTHNVFNEFFIGPNSNYVRLTLQPNLWMAFQGMGKDLNILLNLASIQHDVGEARVLPIDNDYIPKYNW